MHWQDFRSGNEVTDWLRTNVALAVRTNKLDLGRKHYALTLTMGVMSAIFCNVGRIVAVEFGVGSGGGLLDLCKAASFFRTELGMEIDVYGLDNATGLPETSDYRDHPELWHTGQFQLRDPEQLREKLPPYAHLVLGDIADTVNSFRDILASESPLGFAAVDVDYYHSTMSCLKILNLDVSCYFPVVPMYFDDFMVTYLTSNDWCGQKLAISEFNRENPLRKIQENRYFNTLAAPGRTFHGCHMLDHKLRNGQATPRKGFSFFSAQFV